MANQQQPRGSSDADRPMNDVYNQSAYYRLFDEAEKVRWRMSDIRWNEIDKSRVSDDWLALIRTVFDAELTTYEATERFFKDFAGDSDFTQWLSVWLYEETKHPSVLLRYLHHFGEALTSEDVLRGRETHPFVSSKMATLCMNINSEILVSSLYVNISRCSPEPVLGNIFRCLGADEARHASHFHTYAKRMLDSTEDSTEKSRMRRDAVTVLHFWIESTKKVTHPVSLLINRLQERTNVLPPGTFETIREEGRKRQFGMCSSLLEQPVKTMDALKAALKELWWASA